MSSPRRTIPLSVWIFIIAFAVRLLVLVQFSEAPYFIPKGGDMRFYLDWARRIAGGQLTDHKAFYGLPGYPYLLALLFVLIGFDPFAVGVLQAISEGLIAVVIFRIAKEVIAGERGRAVGILAAMGWVLFQPAEAFSAIVMPTTFVVLAFWGILLWSMRTQSKSWWKPWLGMGIITGAVSMVIATILFAVPVAIAAIVRNLKRPAAILGATAVLFAGIYLGAAPCWLHNYFIAKEPVMLSAHSGVNFWIGNNPVANGYPKMPPGLRASQEGMLKDSIRLAEEAAGHPLTRSEVSRYWSTKAKNYIWSHPKEWGLLMLKKVRNIWNAYQYDDLSIITALSDDNILLPGLRYGFVAALAIPGLIMAWKRYPRSRWVTAGVLLNMAVLLPVFVTERYRLATVPGLLLSGTTGLLIFWDSLACRRWVAASSYLALGIAATFFVSLPQEDETLWSLDCYNSGLKALENGDLQRAQAKLERAFAYVPDNSDINFGLGNLWLAKHDRTRAKLFYRRAIEISPDNVGALNNLSVLAIAEKQWPLARLLLTKALTIEKDDAKVHYLLAYADYNAGDVTASKQEIAKAVLLRPAQPEFQHLQEQIQTGAKPAPIPFHP